MNKDILKKSLAEFIGTCFLVMIVVGSGIMAENLSSNELNVLLANTIATGAGLTALILIFIAISGAHFNPAVTLVMFFKGEISMQESLSYICFQILGGLLGVILANVMFGLEAIQISENVRGGTNIYLAELIATFGLIMTILGVRRISMLAIAPAVGLYISAGYWFTSSTSFANPAVTISRMFTDTFTGIAPSSVAYFIIGQLIGALMGNILYNKIDSN